MGEVEGESDESSLIADIISRVSMNVIGHRMFLMMFQQSGREPHPGSILVGRGDSPKAASIRGIFSLYQFCISQTTETKCFQTIF